MPPLAKLCGSLFLLLASLGASAQDAATSADPVEAAMAQARARRVPLLVDFQAPWCYSCYYMAKNVLNGPEWERVHRTTVTLELDADSPEGTRWAQAWRVKAMPTYLVFSAEGQELGRILGEQTRADFYGWLANATARSNTLDALKAKVAQGGDAAVPAAREVLRTHHARYDGAGGLQWFMALPPKARASVARDREAGLWIGRLEVQRAMAEKDDAACVQAGAAVLAGNLGCERPYELDKVLACSASLPDDRRRELLRPQVELMQLLVDKRVLADSMRCADERSIVLASADLHAALGDKAAEALVLDRAIADVKSRIGDDLKKDRSLSDNLRVYLERAGKVEDLDALFPKLMAAYPDDYVYAYRHAKSLASRGLHEQALPFYEQAAARAYGVNRLRNAELRARSLQAIGRTVSARQVLGEALQANGPWFPDDAAKLKVLMDELRAKAS